VKNETEISESDTCEREDKIDTQMHNKPQTKRAKQNSCLAHSLLMEKSYSVANRWSFKSAKLACIDADKIGLSFTASNSGGNATLISSACSTTSLNLAG